MFESTNSICIVLYFTSTELGKLFEAVFIDKAINYHQKSCYKVSPIIKPSN